jgi:predicted transcriptional regulator
VPIGSIEKPVGSQRILVYLYRNKKVTVTELIRDADFNQRTAYAALDRLSMEKLIEMDEGSGFPQRKYYKLTKKGKDVANHLEKVDILLTE